MVGDRLLPESTWQQCVHFLQDELPSQQFNTWIRPLRAEMGSNSLRLLAPNRFVKDWVNDKFIERIHELISDDPLISSGVKNAVFFVYKPFKLNKQFLIAFVPASAE